VVINSYAFHFACEATGASDTRSSLRPLFCEGPSCCTTRAQSASRDSEIICLRHHPRKRVIQYSRDVGDQSRGRGV
jgi:hypothetical protein